MFQYKEFAAFKQHLRDFLVQTKAFASQDNTALFADEQAQLKEVCLYSHRSPCRGSQMQDHGLRPNTGHPRLFCQALYWARHSIYLSFTAESLIESTQILLT